MVPVWSQLLHRRRGHSELLDGAVFLMAAINGVKRFCTRPARGCAAAARRPASKRFSSSASGARYRRRRPTTWRRPCRAARHRARLAMPGRVPGRRLLRPSSSGRGGFRSKGRSRVAGSRVEVCLAQILFGSRVAGSRGRWLKGLLAQGSLAQGSLAQGSLARGFACLFGRWLKGRWLKGSRLAQGLFGSRVADSTWPVSATSAPIDETDPTDNRRSFCFWGGGGPCDQKRRNKISEYRLYQGQNGSHIKNEGEKRVAGLTDKRAPPSFNAQAA